MQSPVQEYIAPPNKWINARGMCSELGTLVATGDVKRRPFDIYKIKHVQD
jgi:hypothetical protein